LKTVVNVFAQMLSEVMKQLSKLSKKNKKSS